MGTRTWSRRGVLTAAGRRRSGLEAIDILGNTITLPVTAERPSPAQNTSWSPYTDTTLYNPALLPAPVQEMIKGGGAKVFQEVNDRQLVDTIMRISSYQSEMNLLGLDQSNPIDCQLYADLVSIVDPENGVGWDRWIRLDRTDFGVPYIKVINELFMTTPDKTPEGTGYAMVARQIAAAKEIARRTNTQVIIDVNAVNSNLEGLTGASVWPKIGYDFLVKDVPIEVMNKIRQKGFTKDYYNVSEIMLSRLPDGTMGFDVWREATEGVNFYLHGTTIIKPNGNPTLSEQVTREYGKRKGFVKSQASEAMFDDAVLRDVWASLSRKN